MRQRTEDKEEEERFEIIFTTGVTRAVSSEKLEQCNGVSAVKNKTDEAQQEKSIWKWLLKCCENR